MHEIGIFGYTRMGDKMFIKHDLRKFVNVSLLVDYKSHCSLLFRIFMYVKQTKNTTET